MHVRMYAKCKALHLLAPMSLLCMFGSNSNSSGDYAALPTEMMYVRTCADVVIAHIVESPRACCACLAAMATVLTRALHC